MSDLMWQWQVLISIKLITGDKFSQLDYSSDNFMSTVSVSIHTHTHICTNSPHVTGDIQVGTITQIRLLIQEWI